MEKYKVCPACGERNSTTIFECTCGNDLSTVRVVDEDSERLIKAQLEHTETTKGNVRKCECGKINPPGARKCAACGEDISDIQPIALAADQIAQYILSSLDGSYTFPITDPICTIGREQQMKEYLETKSYVSRSQAKLTIANGDLYITNLSRTNFTYVNNEKLTGDQPRKLLDGDEIGLGGLCVNGTRQEQAAYFLVRICSCT
jgi:pSer/pThr/pTyr-binding forkhead associated (FHA) protein